jgi:hypothetical protein
MPRARHEGTGRRFGGGRAGEPGCPLTASAKRDETRAAVCERPSGF